jgi:hypothetical protein
VRHAQGEDGHDQLKNGKLVIPGFGSYRILESLTAESANGGYISSLQIGGLPGNVPVFALVNLHDDDDQYLADDPPLFPSALNLQSPPLPVNQRSAEFVTNIQPAYAAAYILPVDANALGLNSQQQTIPFKRNAAAYSIAGTPFDSGNLQLKGTDRVAFWAYSVVFGYQSIFVQGVFPLGPFDDGDPDDETAIEGATFEPLGNPLYSVIFLENIRDVQFRGAPQRPFGYYAVPQLAIPEATQYRDRIYAVVAHEIGHAPGHQGNGADHAEVGVMRDGAPGNLTFTRFSATSIVRFRKTASWTTQ